MDWNYVSLQQASGSSGIESTYGRLDLVMNEVLKIKNDVKFIWNMTWAYQQNSTHNDFGKYDKDQNKMYSQIVNSVKNKVLTNDRIEAIIPNGTAIQNARTSFIGDNLTRDGYHLSLDLGRYIAGLTLVSKLTGIDLSELSFIPNNLNSHHKDIAIESVVNSINKPFEVTESINKNTLPIAWSINEDEYSLVLNSKFDESKVEIKVDFSDGTSKTYYAKDMLFGYAEVDFTKFGKHDLKISVIELDIYVIVEIEIIPSIVNTHIVEYDKQINLGNKFDESSVKCEVTYDNEEVEYYDYKSLLFDYTNCDFSQKGTYSINITLPKYNITKTIEVEVVDACIVDAKVLRYAKTNRLYNNYDEDSVLVSVIYSNGEEIINKEDKLVFDYSLFDNTKVGNQKIYVSVVDTELELEINVEVINEIKILMVGNSYSDDTKQWAHEVAESLGVKVTVANLFIASCTLDTHYNNLINDNAAYQYKTYNTNTNTWSTQNEVSIKSALGQDDWDIVTLQQASSDSGIESTYSNIDNIMDEILKIKDDVKFVWNMTWAYQQNSTHNGFNNYEKDQKKMYDQIVSTVKNEVLTNDRIEMIIPNGTAIQNARTSFVGDCLTRDGYHLSLDLGRYIAATTMITKLFNIEIDDIEYAPSTLNDEYKNVAIESVKNAIAKPFEIVESQFKEYPIDLSNHIKIDYMPIGCAYYNSTGTNYNQYYTNDGTAIKFVASKVFDKTTLPVGSIIDIKPGYQYRPEAWLSDEKQTSRPDNTNIRYIFVTEEWWGDYIKRAFNISANNNASLMFNMDEAIDAFSIYVPKELFNEQTNNPYLESDTSLIEGKGLNMDDYELYDFNYYNGYYYSSQDAVNLSIKHDVSNATKFICTEGFTKETLPVGSILVIDEGYQYRPDGWKQENTINNNRPGNVSTNVIVIDEAWWGDFIVRGFNISIKAGGTVNQIPHEVASHFRIYIQK